MPLRRKLASALVLFSVAAATVITFFSAAPAVAATGITLCAQVGKAAGFSRTTLVTAVAVAMAESSCNPAARHVNSNGSVDRGLWQINDAAHPGVSDACAFDPQCNANAAFAISNSGTNWTPWSTFNNGAYKAFLAQAQTAVNQVFSTGTSGFGYYNAAGGGMMHVRNALNSSGPWDAQWATNWPAGAIPLIGDWGGDGADGFGYYNPADGTMHLRNALNSSGPWDFQWSTNWPAGAIPLIGNWDGTGGDGFGYYNPADGTMHVRNALNSSGPWDAQWATNWPAGAIPVIGNWDGTGGDGFGYYNPADSTMHLRNVLNSSGPWDFQWAANWPAGSVPLTGDWDGK